MSSSEHDDSSFATTSWEAFKRFVLECSHVVYILFIVALSLLLVWAFFYLVFWCFGMLPRQRSRLRLSREEEEVSASLLSRMERGVAGSEHVLQEESGWVEDQRMLAIRPHLPPKTSQAYRKIQYKLTRMRIRRVSASFYKYAKRGVVFPAWCFRWCWNYCGELFQQTTKSAETEETEPLLRESLANGELVDGGESTNNTHVNKGELHVGNLCSDDDIEVSPKSIVDNVQVHQTQGSKQVVVETAENTSGEIEPEVEGATYGFDNSFGFVLIEVNTVRHDAERVEPVEVATGTVESGNVSTPTDDSQSLEQLDTEVIHLPLTVDDLVDVNDCDTPYKKNKLAGQKFMFSNAHVTGAFERMCVAELKYRHGILPYSHATDMMFRREFREMFEKRNMRRADRHDAMNRCMVAIWLPSDGEIDYLKHKNSMYFKERRRWADDEVRNTDSWVVRFGWWLSGAGTGSGVSRR